MIPVNSIKLPIDIQLLCEGWADNVDCMLRAVSSTGGLTLGSIRPSGCDTDEKWYLAIWREFANDLGYCARVAFKHGNDDSYELECAEGWADDVCGALAKSYGLEDWEACDD